MWAFLLACGDGSRGAGPGGSAGGDSRPAHSGAGGPVRVTVTLDGAPAVARVYVDGDPEPRFTGADGALLLPDGAEAVVAAHDRARSEFGEPGRGEVAIALESLEAEDHPGYRFQDPGGPDDAAGTDTCAHCHHTQVVDWSTSAHAGAASSEVLWSLLRGTSSATRAACGGRWTEVAAPGGGTVEACVVAPPVPDDGCADCHAPGIDGALGGRAMTEAAGVAFRAGVHCDVCHKVEAVDAEAPGRGVAGALKLHRPSPPGFAGLPERPVMFGPYDDVANPRMGGVRRDLFREPELCAACHELDRDGGDPARWPGGRLPVLSTWTEWRSGGLAPQAPCQSCHLPPDPSALNGADLGLHTFGESVANGFERAPGEVVRHLFAGPGQPELGMLRLAVSLEVETRLRGGVLTVDATVGNAGAGHAIPTGVPLRALLLVVTATCGGEPLAPVDGDVLPGWAGALDARAPGTTWPGARVGDRIRVVARPGGFRDLPGPGPFGDGTFGPAEKGLPIERWAGERAVVEVVGDEVVLDGPLPAGDLAYRLPAAPDGAPPLAGAPGFAFARVLVDAAGREMVPDGFAVDVRSDDRPLPGERVTTTHAFAAPCDDPAVDAVVLYRPLPWGLAAERGLPLADQVAARVTR